MLELDRVCGIADVSIGKYPIGRISWPYGELDLTGKIEPGKPFVLSFLVKAVQRTNFTVDFNFYEAVKKKNSLYNRGIAGDAILRAEPQGLRIDGVFIRPSVRKQELSVQLELFNPGVSGSAQFRFDIFDQDRHIVRSETYRRDIAATDKALFEFRIPWKNPRLWNYKDPYLYNLQVEITMSQRGIRDIICERFGFREFRTEGRTLLLNEKPFRFRPIFTGSHYIGGMPEAIRKVMTDYFHAGFNLVELEPQDTFITGKICFDREWAGIADEIGMPLIVPMPSFVSIIPDVSNMTAKQLSLWETKFVHAWKRLRNHPSLFILMTGFNVFGNHGGANPMRIGNASRQRYPFDDVRRKLEAGERLMNLMRKYDPTRPVASHHSGAVGDIMTQDLYLNFLPLQERERWLAEYVQTGDRPYMAVEFGCPYEMTLMRGRECGPGKVFNTEPMLTEICSIYLGDRAYAQESDLYRRRVAETFLDRSKFASWHSEPSMRQNPVYHELLALFITNTFRSWRAYDLAGGLCPWRDGAGWNSREIPPAKKATLFFPRTSGRGAIVESVPVQHYCRYEKRFLNQAGEALIANNSDTLAYVAGKLGDHTEKRHHFIAGGKIEKQLALLNDTGKDSDFNFRCEIYTGGKMFSSSHYSGTIPSGNTKLIPIGGMLPHIEQVTEGQIRISGTLAGKKHADEFPFRVYPETKQQTEEVLLFDPAGSTGKYFRSLKLPFREIAIIPETSARILVVGEKNLSAADFPWEKLRMFAERGGRVLLMGDSPEMYRQRLGFRVGRHLARRCFMISSIADFLPLKSVSNDELRDWNGRSCLVPEISGVDLNDLTPRYHQGLTTPKYGYHWGNQGSVCSSPIEKPHYSGWTPLVETEYALSYTPLMTLTLGKGMIMLTTFDFVNREERDPAAEHLFLSVLETLRTQKLVPRRKGYASVSPEELKFLNHTGLDFAECNTVPESGILIVGESSPLALSAIKNFAEAGNSVLFLPRKDGITLPGFRVASKPVGKIVEIPSWPILAGLSLADFYLKTDDAFPILHATAPGADTAANGLLGYRKVGKGEMVFLQLLPSQLKHDKYDYRKFPAWRWTGVFSRILTNMGGSFVTDRSLGMPDARYYAPDYNRGPDGDDVFRHRCW